MIDSTIQIIRLLLGICMLGAASYFDFKNREIHDTVWILFGTIGAALYVITLSPPSSIDFMYMGITTAFAFLFMYLRLYGGADAFALIALGVIMPQYQGIPIPIVVLIISVIISTIMTVMMNIMLNIKQMTREKIFDGFEEPLHRKIFAFCLLHKKRNNEKFSFLAEERNDGNKKFKFKNDVDDDFADGTGCYVSYGIPLVIFMCVAFVIVSVFIVI